MDESAIRLIQQTAIGDYNGKQERLAGTGQIALPDNYNLHDLEKFQPGRRRFRGAFATHVLADFVQYVKANLPSLTDLATAPNGFIDADKLSAKVFFNLFEAGGPGHADFTGTLQLQKTAAFAALLAINGKPQDQQQLVDWLIDWAGCVSPNDGSLYTVAIEAVRNIQITQKSTSNSEVGNFAATGSVLDEIEAKSRNGLPPGFVFNTEPYLGLQKRTFSLQLRVLTGGDKPKLVLRIDQLEREMEDIAQEFKEVLFRDLDGEAIKLYIGGFAP